MLMLHAAADANEVVELEICRAQGATTPQCEKVARKQFENSRDKKGTFEKHPCIPVFLSSINRRPAARSS